MLCFQDLYDYFISVLSPHAQATADFVKPGQTKPVVPLFPFVFYLCEFRRQVNECNTPSWQAAIWCASVVPLPLKLGGRGSLPYISGGPSHTGPCMRYTNLLTGTPYKLPTHKLVVFLKAARHAPAAQCSTVSSLHVVSSGFIAQVAASLQRYRRRYHQTNQVI